MPFLSHGNPEKLKNMVEFNRKHNLKFAETGKVLFEAAKIRKRQMEICENQKIRKKATESWKR